MRIPRRHVRDYASLDQIARDQVSDLFSPPLLWRLKPGVDDTFQRIVNESSGRQMLATTAPQRRTAITGAVSSVRLDGAAWRSYRFGDRAWQADGWRLYDITGQLRFVANWVGSSASRCGMYVAEIGPDGKPSATAVEDPDIAALASGPLGAADVRSESIRLLGIDLFVAGEAYVIVEAGGAEDGSDAWWVVTARQIKRVGDTITVTRSPLHGGGVMEYRDGIDMIMRVWTPHPNDTMEPDSPTRSAIPDLRELEALRKREFAELDSRLAGAGLLAIPEGMELPRGDDDPPGLSGFMIYLMRAFSRSLRDRSSSEAMVPIMISGTPEDISGIRHITFWSELSDQITTMRESALRGLAQSLDIPPEVLLGLGSANHWSAWAISDEAVQTQIKPILSRIAAALTTGYLHPALEALGVKDPWKYVYQFDTAPLTTKPNRTTDAINYHDRDLLSDEAARSAGAWGEESAPSQEERIRRLVEKLLLANADAVLGDPALREYLGLPQSEVQDQQPATTPGQPPVEPEPVTQDNAPPEQQPDSGQQPDDSQTPPGLQVAAVLAARRALGLAGTRLVPHPRRPADVPRHQLHTIHGPVEDVASVRKAMAGWADFDDIITGIGVDPHRFHSMIDEYCTGLLRTGRRYSDSDLYAHMASTIGGRCG